MKILMTQRALINWAGTEMLTIEVANELAKRGHDVAVFSPRVGFPASVMIPSGVWVKSRLSELPWAPDVIHGHHHLQAIAALSYFVDAAAIYYSHGVIPWPEQIPIHPRIRRYIVMCEAMVASLKTVDEITGDRITVIPNFVNTRRFSEVRTPPARITKALLYGGSSLTANELLMLEGACAAQGISLEKIGYAYGNPQERPEVFLQSFDLVFAIGRCALEAVACGCAVIPLVPGQAGSLLTSANFDDYAFSNLSPRYFTSGRRIGTDWLAAELDSYSSERTAELTTHVRSTRTLTNAVDRIEQVYLHAINDHACNPEVQKHEFAPYLEKLSSSVDLMADNQRELDWLRADLGSKVDHIGILHAELASRADKIATLHAELGSQAEQIAALHTKIAELDQALAERPANLNQELPFAEAVRHLLKRFLRGIRRRLKDMF